MYKVVKEGKGGITARLVADSISSEGNRISTFELEYHRYIHSELMTHRLFSRNAMSSRAVPVSKMIEQVKTSPATPIHWGKNKSGMQADEENDNLVRGSGGVAFTAEEWWKLSVEEAANAAEALSEAGYHKQIVNRLLEPFQKMKTVVTATEFENFFWLRRDEDAQPEIKELADLMFECLEENEPELLSSGEWHTPYVEHFRYKGELTYQCEQVDSKTGETILDNISEEQALAISASCCAQVSYRNIDNSFEKAMKVYENLGVGSNKVHASPFEHQGSPMQQAYEGGDINTILPETWEKGVTHLDNGDYASLWSGNFKGWIQHRQLLDNHTKW